MDVFTIRLGILSACLVCLGSLGGIVFLAASGHPNSPALESIASLSAGAIFGTLVNPKAEHKPAENGKPPL